MLSHGSDERSAGRDWKREREATTPPPAPVFAVSGGTFYSPVTVTASAYDAAGSYSIYYTTDGTDPITSETSKETSSLSLTISETTTIRACSYLTPTLFSEIVSQTYTIKNGPVDALEIVSGDATTGVISTAGDIVYRRFQAAAGEVVTVSLDMPACDVDAHIKLLPESGSLLWEGSDTNGANAATALASPSLVIPTSGTWFIRVYDEGLTDTSYIPFTVTMTLSANPDANEPANDERSTAIALASGTPTTSYLATKADLDWYKIQANSGQMISFSGSITISKVDLHIQVYSELGTSASWSLSDTNGGDAPTSLASAQFLIPTSGIYYVCVNDNSNDEWDMDNPYTIQVNVNSNPDLDEPANDLRASPSTLTPGTATLGYIATKGDVDWYIFHAIAGQMLTFTGSIAISAVDLSLQVYSESATSASWTQSDSDGSTALTSLTNPQVVIASTGDYYLRVGDVSDNDWDSDRPYTVQVNLAANPDADEPSNDLRATPSLLVPGVSRTGYIATKGDIDWYMFHAAAGQMLTFTGTIAISPVDLYLQVFSETATSSSWSQSDSDGSTASTSLSNPQVVISATGDYLLRVSDTSDNDWDSDSPYGIQVNLLDNPDLNEPANDAKANAAALSPGLPAQGYIATKGDADWYWFTANAGQTLAFTGSLAASPVDLYLGVYTETGTSASWYVNDSDGSTGATSITKSAGVLASGGKYYLRVSDTGDTEWDSANPYTIQVNLTN